MNREEFFSKINHIKPAQEHKDLKIAILDDDFAIRYILKKFLIESGRLTNTDVTVYTSNNGIEGLGYIYITEPDLIIVDSTLPKYGGLEIIDYINNNDRLDKLKVPIVFLHEDKNSLPISLPEKNLIYLNKNNPNFFQNLNNVLSVSISLKNPYLNTADKRTRLQKTLSRLKSAAFYYGVRFANVSDISIRTVDISPVLKRPSLYIKWLTSQILVSIALSFLYLTTGPDTETNIEQKNKDFRSLRVRYYPTIITLIISIGVLIFQVSAFAVTGGALLSDKAQQVWSQIFNTEQSSTELNIDLSDSNYETSSLAITSEGSLELSQKIIEVKEEETLDQTDQIDQLDETDQIDQTDQTDQANPIVIPEEITYDSTSPSVIFNQGVNYKTIVGIRENSSINTFETSILEAPEREDLSSQIRYQISPDKETWYYFNGDEGWEKTSLGAENTNSIQELNKSIQGFNSDNADIPRNLFIKAFLISDGKVQTTLKAIVIEYFAPSPAEEKSTVYASTDLRISNATYFGGDRKISGYLYDPAKNEKITEGGLDGPTSQYTVEIYLSLTDDLLNPVLIDTTEVKKDNQNNLYFESSVTTSIEGGFIAASLTNKSNGYHSQLSRAIELSTFIINSSADKPDTVLDGYCRDEKGLCTLRAAIMESNKNSVPDNLIIEPNADIILTQPLPEIIEDGTMMIGSKDQEIALTYDEEVPLTERTGLNIQGQQFSIKNLSFEGLGENCLTLTNPANSTIINNNIKDCNIGIYVENADSTLQISSNSIENNKTGIVSIDSLPTIIGNRIRGNNYFGIVSTSSSEKAEHNPNIGGGNDLSNSLCEGSEKNCIEGNGEGGVYQVGITPQSSSYLWSINNYGEGNGKNGEINIEDAVYARIELKSSSLFESNSLKSLSDIPIIRIYPTFNKNIISALSSCSLEASCGSTDSNEYSYTVHPEGFDPNDITTWLTITTSTINKQGDQVDRDILNFEGFSLTGYTTTPYVCSDYEYQLKCQTK